MRKFESKPIVNALTFTPFKSHRYRYNLNGITPNYSHSKPINRYVPTPEQRRIKRLKTALEWLIFTSPTQTVYCKQTNRRFPFKLNFITLTLSSKQTHDDEFYKEYLLKPFCKWLMRQGATGYVWKAEKQLNGNIHFHVTTNKYIHYKAIRDKWNDLQTEKGTNLDYIRNHGNTDANSTDVKAVRSTDKAIRYMIKYIAKQQTDRDQVSKRQFGYSRNLANIKIQFNETEELYQEVSTYIGNVTNSYVYHEFVTTCLHQNNDVSELPADLRARIFDRMSKK